MTLMAVAIDSHTVWWIALGLGFVVIAVVIVLMTLLLSYVRDIELGSGALLNGATALVGNTSAIPYVQTTATVAEEIKAEALIHYAYLQSQVEN